MNPDSEKQLIRTLLHKERLKANEALVRKIIPINLLLSMVLLAAYLINAVVSGDFSQPFLLTSGLILFALYLPVYIFRDRMKYDWPLFTILIVISLISVTSLQIYELLYYGHDYYVFILCLLVITTFLIIPKEGLAVFFFSFLVFISTVLYIFTHDKDQLMFSIPRAIISVCFVFLIAIVRNIEFKEKVFQTHMLEGYKRDIEIKNKMLDSSVKKLKDADLLKTEYVSNISHELKTPITILSGYVDLLKNDDRLQDSKSQKRLSTMDKNVKRLFNTVSDLFNMGELDKEHETVTMENFSAIEIFNPLSEEFSEVCEKEGRIFKATLADIEIKGNPSQISIVLENLLLNALKFTETGNTISVNIIDEKGGRVRLSVEDDAMAIPKEEQEKIFEKFYQSGGGLDRKFPGTGLGLYISQKILREHGSELFIKSEGDTGVEFFFYLKLA